MINKKLLNFVSESKKYIAFNVISQWVSLAANIAIMLSVTAVLSELLSGSFDKKRFALCVLIIAIGIVLRFICAVIVSRMSFKSSACVKLKMRDMIFSKLLRLGASYRENVGTAELLQFSVEGVDQLETYFASYIPQFFYAMLAPITLFAVLCFVNIPSAVILLVCVPLIPITIVAVQKFAKKLLSKYWGQYTQLGDFFLENVQGLTTLKIYQADEFKAKQMERESENFRKITMRVLTMQLNSVTVMDLIAYGGAALGVIVSALQFKSGRVDFQGALLIILLSADFFIPMRRLGSFFHIAMNGMAASDKIFKFLETPENNAEKCADIGDDLSIKCKNISFSYDKEREILHNISLNFPQNSFTAIVGESGSGKSTVASILTGASSGYSGSVKIGDIELSNINESSLMKNITYISHNSYIFSGTIRDNLLMGKPGATEEEMRLALDKTNLLAFANAENGLDTVIKEQGSNLSGGQRQRLALARALLHNSPIYIFDEATSNIDVESENKIISLIYELAKTKTVILISHRLANVTGADNIYVLENGCVAESGNHDNLLASNGVYAGLWESQQSLEEYANGGERE